MRGTLTVDDDVASLPERALARQEGDEENSSVVSLLARPAGRWGGRGPGVRRRRHGAAGVA